MILALQTKNSIAKLIVLIWIVCLLLASLAVIRFAISFDINAYFLLQGEARFAPPIVLEMKVILLMLAVSMMGGVSFLIKDFYVANKNANLYDVTYSDYIAGRIDFSEFNRLVTLEIYMGRFNHTWMYWFFIQPILSSFLGLIAFAIARSGLGVLQGASAVTADISIQNVYLYAVFTFLAGFSSHKFIAWLDRLADKIFSTTLPEKVQDQKTMVQQMATIDRVNLKDTIVPTNVSIEGVDSPVENDKIDTKVAITGFETIKLDTATSTTKPPKPGMKTIR